MSKGEWLAAWRQYVAGGRTDEVLRNMLLEIELPRLRRLAAKAARELHSQVSVDDLIAEGALALVDAAQRYEPDQGVAFWSFASRRAIGRMLDWARHMDPVSRTMRQRQKQRARFEQEFASRSGQPPQPEDTMAALGWTRAQWAASFPPESQSIDAERDNGEGALESLRHVLAACDDAPDGAAISEAFFRDVCRGLPWDHQVMLYLWLVRDSSMQSIGVAFGLSESRVSQQLSYARKLLLERLQKES